MNTPENQLDRILLLIKELTKRGEIKNPTDFSRKINFDLGYFSLIKNKKRAVPPELIQNVSKYYKVNPEYLYDGVGEMFLGDNKEAEKKTHVVSAHPAIECLQHKIEGLHQVIKMMAEEQDKMRKEIAELQEFKRSLIMKQYNR